MKTENKISKRSIWKDIRTILAVAICLSIFTTIVTADDSSNKIEKPAKESIKNANDIVPYPENIEGLSKEDLIKAGFDKDVSSIPLSIGEIGDATDNTLVWNQWYNQNLVYYYGGDAAQSGHIYNNQNTMMQATITGPGTLNFYWSVLSEANFDYLEFYVDGTLKNRISGNVPWQKKSYYIGSGMHTLRWRYVKDGSVSISWDAGWVDYVVFVAPKVTLYENSNYGGRSKTFAGDTYWVGSDFNDIASSVKVPAGYRVTLYENNNYEGNSKTFTSSSISIGSLDNKVSSLRISKI